MIKIVGSNKTFKMNQHDFKALKSINMEIKSAGLYIISGESGSGKTTLLNCIAGIDQFDEENQQNQIPKGQVSFVFQDYNLIQHLSIEKNLQFVLDINRNNNVDKMHTLLSDLSLSNWINHKPHQLSGGQKQRVAILRALLTEKPIVIADEPTGNLDEENAKEIAKILKEISKEKIVIVATHNLSLFQNLADKIFTVNQGVLSEEIQTKSSKPTVTPKLADVEERLSFKQILMFATKGYRSQYSKLILVFLTLLLSLLFSMSAINMMVNSIYKIKYDHYQDLNFQFVEFVGYQGDFQSDRLSSIDDKTISSIILQNQTSDYMLFYDEISPRITIDGELTEIVVNRIYQTTNLPYDSLIDKNNIQSNEVVISDSIAYRLLNATDYENMSELIGKTIEINNSLLVISNVVLLSEYVPTGVNFTVEEIQAQERFLNSIFVNNETYQLLSRKTMRDELSILFNGSNTSVRITDYANAFHRSLAYGDFDLSENGVIIPYNLAENLSNGNMGNLLGTGINIEVYKYIYGLEEPISSNSMIFIIQGIFTDSVEEIPWMFNDAKFQELSYMYGKNNYQSSALNGIALSNYSSDLIKSLDDIQITDFTYASLSINVTHSYLQSIAFIIFIVGIVLLTISVLVIISYMNGSILQRKNEIGLLVSLNITIKDISMILLTEIIAILISVIFVVSIGLIGIIHLLNNILISEKFISFQYIYYDSLSILIIFIISIIVTTLFSIMSMNQLKKKTAVELIKFV